MTSPVGSKRQVPDNAETSEPKRPETAVPIPSARAAISSSSSAISSSAMALLTAQPAHYRPLPNPEGFGPTLRRPRAVAAGRPDAPALPSQFLRRPVPNQDALHQPVALRRENRQGLPDSPYTAAQASALSSSSSSYASASFVRINAALNSVPAPSSQASAAIPDPSQFSEDPAISNFAAPGYVHPEQRESLVSISSRCPEPMQLPLPSHIYNKYAASAFVNNYYRIRNSIKHKTPFHLPIPRMNIRIESVGEKLGEGRNSIA
ncbi:MAG TPA: hypothetical protein VLE89_00850, partial [Chlamydiales bacterium]|nr:hypothetical protein [Chlamydiales bacterium]